MADEPVRTYLDKKKDFEAATESVRKLIKPVVDAGQKLAGWQTVRFSNVGGGIPASFPSDLPLKPDRTINAKDFPTLDDIARALSDWHGMYRDLRNAYQAIDRADRGSIEAPPDYY